MLMRLIIDRSEDRFVDCTLIAGRVSQQPKRAQPQNTALKNRDNKHVVRQVLLTRQAMFAQVRGIVWATAARHTTRAAARLTATKEKASQGRLLMQQRPRATQCCAALRCTRNVLDRGVRIYQNLSAWFICHLAWRFAELKSFRLEPQL